MADRCGAVCPAETLDDAEMEDEEDIEADDEKDILHEARAEAEDTVVAKGHKGPVVEETLV